ncbi:uncharacterized protein LOC123212457 isoform X2 [Mangifera indica]|uniref:uncharacterized protein LOC123212457 isoform X2 n=1 Tax=Mangifera indica TaxID=29780 RepID=UPI001CFAD941|nr:uncharacterized protein LOC123212457 isoform X2 [Mangifera indica]
MRLFRRCSSVNPTETCGTVTFSAPLNKTLLIAALRFSVPHVYLTCFGKEHSTMTCPGMFVVLVICLAVASVTKVLVLNFAFALRFSAALEIQWPLLDFCCKMNSTSRQLAGFMICLQQVACIFSIIACIVGSDELQDASQILNLLADLVYCSVCACMQTQHKIELDKRDGVFGPRPMAVPAVQEMSRIDQQYPPSVGYPPQQTVYGQPYPPPAQSYPPPVQSYPPPVQSYPPPAQGYPTSYPPPGYPR